MKRLLLGAALALLIAGPARAHDAYDDTQSDPLQLLAYALYPVGYTAEWLVMRPIHFVVSSPELEHVFGHTPHEAPFGESEYQPYEPQPAQ